METAPAGSTANDYSSDGFDLQELLVEQPAIPSYFGQTLAKAAAVSFELQGHSSGVTMPVRETERTFNVTWIEIEDSDRRCFNDETFAAEFGAYGIAILLVRRLTSHTVIERSRKGTGFDFWLGVESGEPLLFNDKMRLEVSGMCKENERAFRARVRSKSAQINTSNTDLAGIVVVVEFGRPMAEMRSV